ncbi:hypothetical protein I4641_10515, partial [Waterburya agarophytonicola K14]
MGFAEESEPSQEFSLESPGATDDEEFSDLIREIAMVEKLVDNGSLSTQELQSMEESSVSFSEDFAEVSNNENRSEFEENIFELNSDEALESVEKKIDSLNQISDESLEELNDLLSSVQKDGLEEESDELNEIYQENQINN